MTTRSTSLAEPRARSCSGGRPAAPGAPLPCDVGRLSPRRPRLIAAGLLALALGSGCGASPTRAYDAPASMSRGRGPGAGAAASPAPPSPARADAYGSGSGDDGYATDEKVAEADPEMPSPLAKNARPPADAPKPAVTPGQPTKEEPAPGGGKKDGGSGQDSGVIADKRTPILIYTATFLMAVLEISASLNEVERITREAGGFIVKRTDKMATLRVPAPRFYEVVGRLEKLGDMLQRDVVAQDVTEEFLDTEVRLRNARAMRDRLAQLLAKATTVQDSLLIERELSRISADIDRMEGRLKYLRDRAAFSTITISFEARRTEAPPPSVRLPFPWLRSISLSRLLSL